MDLTTARLKIGSRTAVVLIAALVMLAIIGVVEAQVQVSGRTETSITIDWRPPAPGTQGYYKVWRGQTGGSGRQVVYTSTDLSKTTYTDTGLEKGASYTYTVDLYSPTDQLLDSASVPTCTLKLVEAPNVGLIIVGIFVLALCFLFGRMAAGNPVGLILLGIIVTAAAAGIWVGWTTTALVSPCS